jgi:hypothetical protein
MNLIRASCWNISGTYTVFLRVNRILKRSIV